MKKMKFSESQIVNILKEAEAGVALEELVRQHGFSRETKAATSTQPFWGYKRDEIGVMTIPNHHQPIGET